MSIDSIAISVNPDNIPPHSVQHKPIKRLSDEMPEFSLMRAEKSEDDDLILKFRKASYRSVFTHNEQMSAGGIEDVKPRKIYHSPRVKINRELNAGDLSSFEQRLKMTTKYGVKPPVPIYEENSNSVSPNTSFKKIGASYIKHKEKQVHENYYTHEGEVY